MRIPTEHSTSIPGIVTGICAIIAIAAIVWLVSNKKGDMPERN